MAGFARPSVLAPLDYARSITYTRNLVKTSKASPLLKGVTVEEKKKPEVLSVKNLGMEDRDYQGAGYPSKSKTMEYPLMNSQPNFSWATDEQTMSRLLRGWLIMQIIRDRSIAYTELGKHMNVSKQRVNEMVRDLDRGDNYTRIDTAITEITDSLGGVYAACGVSDVDADVEEERVREWRG